MQQRWCGLPSKRWCHNGMCMAHRLARQKPATSSVVWSRQCVCKLAMHAYTQHGQLPRLLACAVTEHASARSTQRTILSNRHADNKTTIVKAAAQNKTAAACHPSQPHWQPAGLSRLLNTALRNSFKQCSTIDGMQERRVITQFSQRATHPTPHMCAHPAPHPRNHQPRRPKSEVDHSPQHAPTNTLKLKHTFTTQTHSRDISTLPWVHTWPQAPSGPYAIPFYPSTRPLA